MIVTFDVFSALTDSRSGGAVLLDGIVARKGWPVSGRDIYDRWDALNKELHRSVARWVPFAELSGRAMEAALTELGLPNDEAPEISSTLLDSMVTWPAWPDVTAESLRELGDFRLGLLTNIDDELLAGTEVMRLGVFEPDLVVTSQRAQAYKPSAALYHRATELLGPFAHVASSARDVRGAVSADITCIRLARPGHAIDPAGPVPRWTVDSIPQLRGAIASAPDQQTNPYDRPS